MKQMMIQLAEMNLRWSQQKVARARSRRAGAFAQTIIFWSFSLFFLAWFLLGGSWFNIITVVIYIAMGAFFLWRALTVYTDGIWEALRLVAKSRAELRQEMEQD